MSKSPDNTIFEARARQRRQARAMMTALLSGPEDRITSLVRDALHQSGSLLYVVSHLVDSARQEVEDMWYRGDIGIVDQKRLMDHLEAVVQDEARQVS
jgi:hypothetical protein